MTNTEQTIERGNRIVFQCGAELRRAAEQRAADELLTVSAYLRRLISADIRQRSAA